MKYPTLLLGSALWGWTVSKETAFTLLDSFYQHGFRRVDAATNYPINKIPADFRRSENILLEWIRAHGISDLEVIMKIGSINNLRTPDHNLLPSFILLNLDDYQARFGANLAELMIHWDNRAEENTIRQTLEALDSARNRGLQIGLSGIRHPEIYARLNRFFQFNFDIQIKHNLFHSDYPHYPAFHGQARFLTYGINAGGIKLDPAAYRPDGSLKTRGGNPDLVHPLEPALKALKEEANQTLQRPEIQSFNHFGLTFAFHSPDIGGIILGCSRLEQLTDSLEFHRSLLAFDYRDIYLRLKSLHDTYVQNS